MGRTPPPNTERKVPTRFSLRFWLQKVHDPLCPSSGLGGPATVSDQPQQVAAPPRSCGQSLCCWVTQPCSPLSVLGVWGGAGRSVQETLTPSGEAGPQGLSHGWAGHSSDDLASLRELEDHPGLCSVPGSLRGVCVCVCVCVWPLTFLRLQVPLWPRMAARRAERSQSASV